MPSRGRSYSRSPSGSRSSRGRSPAGGGGGSRSGSGSPGAPPRSAPKKNKVDDERDEIEQASKNHFGSRYEPPTSNVIGVFGMSIYTSEEKLEDVMSKFGRLKKVAIVHDQRTRRSRGFGFVTFEDPEDAADARDKMNGKNIDDREVRVDFSITKSAHDSTPGEYRGREDQRSQRDERRGGYGDRDRGYRRRSRDRGGYNPRRSRSRSRDRYERRDRHRDRRDSRSRSRDRYQRSSRRDRSRSRSRGRY